MEGGDPTVPPSFCMHNWLTNHIVDLQMTGSIFQIIHPPSQDSDIMQGKHLKPANNLPIKSKHSGWGGVGWGGVGGNKGISLGSRGRTISNIALFASKHNSNYKAGQ